MRERKEGRRGLECHSALFRNRPQVWRAAINLWVHGTLDRRVAYLKCLTEGTPRYDLHGNVSGEVNAEEAPRNCLSTSVNWPSSGRQGARKPRQERRKPNSRKSLPDTAGSAGLRSFSPDDRVASPGETNRLHAAARPGAQKPPPGLSLAGMRTRGMASPDTAQAHAAASRPSRPTSPNNMCIHDTCPARPCSARPKNTPGSAGPVSADTCESVCRKTTCTAVCRQAGYRAGAMAVITPACLD